MKYKWDRQYLHLGVTLFVVIVCSILFYYVLFENHSLLSGLNTITGASSCLSSTDASLPIC